MKNGTQTLPWRVFTFPLKFYISELERLECGNLDEFNAVLDILKLTNHTPESIEILNKARRRALAISEQSTVHDVKTASQKILVIVNSMDDFLSGSTEIRHVAPFRQAQMVVACNARCIQCVGKYSEEISKGFKIGDEYKKWMTIEEARQSLDHPEDMIVYNMTGSEFFFYKSWKEVAHLLRDNMVVFRNSTNGMILTEDNIRYIVDNDLLRFLLISMDGTKPETLEKIRERVKFDRLVNAIKFLFKYVHEKNYPMDLTITFVIMKDNYKELAELPDFINSLRVPGAMTPEVRIVVQVLDNRGTEGYLDFAEEHHHSLVPHEEFKKSVTTAAARGKAVGIEMIWSYNEPMDHFVARGAPFEGLDEMTRVTIHFDSHSQEEILSSQSQNKFWGWAVSKHKIKEVRVWVNDQEVSNVQYGRKCDWLKNSYPYEGVEFSGLDFEVDPKVYTKEKNLVHVMAVDNKGFKTSHYISMNRN